MENIKVVIIDDEIMSIKILENLLSELSMDIQILGTARTIEDSVLLIDTQEPELVFLDIRLKNGYGFDILDRVKYTRFQVVFITAYDSYAVTAFEFSALHYLLKPINSNDLQSAIQRYQTYKDSNLSPKIVHQVLQNAHRNKHKKLGLPMVDSIQYVDIDEINYCEANAGYTVFFFNNNEKIMVSKPLLTYENLLSEAGFFRIHDKYLISLKEVNRYIKGRGGQVELNSGKKLDVSMRKKNAFLNALGKFFI
ncbi:MAG: DNA-binding response regulator [uncultured Aureispira sp.]|uniref:DNA-binding response regulator n=1 Tax=uncultured Aureispira sp. TaxID=1331704 RepID=A0A6S6SZ01_9BACT|nr:MAG: DNA-binding response regulator [uncultured Aureispira sp.]